MLFSIFLLSASLHRAPGPERQAAHILMSSCWGSGLRGRRKRVGRWRCSHFSSRYSFRLPQRRSAVLTGCKQFLRASVFCEQASFGVSVLEHRAGLCGVGGGGRTEARSGSVTAVSPLFWNNGWSSQLSLSHTALDSDTLYCLPCGGSLWARVEGTFRLFRKSWDIWCTLHVKMKTVTVETAIWNYSCCCFLKVITKQVFCITLLLNTNVIY